jgi:hypothetical protein
VVKEMVELVVLVVVPIIVVDQQVEQEPHLQFKVIMVVQVETQVVAVVAQVGQEALMV